MIPQCIDQGVGVSWSPLRARLAGRDAHARGRGARRARRPTCSAIGSTVRRRILRRHRSRRRGCRRARRANGAGRTRVAPAQTRRSAPIVGATKLAYLEDALAAERLDPSARGDRPARGALAARRPGPRVMQRAEINGAELNYELTGQGPAVALLHEGVCDLRMWDELVEALAPEFTVLLHDMRGYGDRPAGALLAERRPPRPARPRRHRTGRPGGVSYGGRVVLDKACRARVRRGLLLAAAGLRDHEWSAVVREFGDEEERLLDPATCCCD